ncbi:jupiter microtubule associated homolog 2 [Eurytemora carolleeae]|uniref:jupiter microtubule associated homolog 2 n=1 Tax=Eurytemora carolleeae TaxID=1294199 RepID=UPI000C78CE32|nr:jupiter microtubule associated homolog 2 [Eurytemora carolleeae]|eukprot:XP_023327219.1 jupiter microtubule associated homolog 2-like [Eurytemora affinis]
MGIITVGLDEHNKANGRGIPFLQPPGGDSHMAELTNPDIQPSKLSYRCIQPPGGASTDIFGSDSASDTSSETGEPEPYKKPYRLGSSIVLGDEQPIDFKPRNIRKSSMPVTSPIMEGLAISTEARGVKSKMVAPVPPVATPVPTKPNRIPPGGHCSQLW